MGGTFDERMAELADRVGRGRLVGSVTVDQVYAAAQHEDLSYVHPRGGGPKYLERPLTEKHPDYLRDIAARTLEEGPAPAMEAAMEDLAGQVGVHAPVEFGDLRASGHPTVHDNGETVYDRAPEQHRLSEDELRARNERRRNL